MERRQPHALLSLVRVPAGVRCSDAPHALGVSTLMMTELVRARRARRDVAQGVPWWQPGACAVVSTWRAARSSAQQQQPPVSTQPRAHWSPLSRSGHHPIARTQRLPACRTTPNNRSHGQATTAPPSAPSSAWWRRPPAPRPPTAPRAGRRRLSRPGRPSPRSQRWSSRARRLLLRGGQGRAPRRRTGGACCPRCWGALWRDTSTPTSSLECQGERSRRCGLLCHSGGGASPVACVGGPGERGAGKQ